MAARNTGSDKFASATAIAMMPVSIPNATMAQDAKSYGDAFDQKIDLGSSSGRRAGIILSVIFILMFYLAPIEGVRAQSGTPPAFGEDGDIYNEAAQSNGVEIATGSFSYNSPGVSIGGEGEGGLSFFRTYNSGIKGGTSNYLYNSRWSHNLTGGISRYTPNVYHGGRYFVDFLGTSFVFDGALTNNGDTINEINTGAASLTLNTSNGLSSWGRLELTLEDGTVAFFDRKLRIGNGPDGKKTWGAPFTYNQATITSVSYPNGVVLDFHYDYETTANNLSNYYRLQSVTDNRGYQIHLEYVEKGSTAYNNVWWHSIASAKAINNAIEPCSSLASQCGSGAYDWPTESYSGSYFRINRLHDAVGSNVGFLYQSELYATAWDFGLLRAITQPSADDQVVVDCLAGLRASNPSLRSFGSGNTVLMSDVDISGASCAIDRTVLHFASHRVEGSNGSYTWENLCVASSPIKVRGDCLIYVNKVGYGDESYTAYTREVSGSELEFSSVIGWFFIIPGDTAPYDAADRRNFPYRAIVRQSEHGADGTAAGPVVLLETQRHYDEISSLNATNPLNQNANSRVPAAPLIERISLLEQSGSPIRETEFTYFLSPGDIGSQYYQLASVSKEEGNSREPSYDDRGNLWLQVSKPKSVGSENDLLECAYYGGQSAANCGVSPITATCSNPKTCNKATSLIDANGNVTNIAYDGSHGGIVKKTLPAAVNGIRPETRYTWGQKYAWRENAGGNYTRAATPIWVTLSEEYCATSAADAGGNCAAGASDKVVTAYEYQTGSSTKGSNVFRIGIAVTADGQTLRTCYELDEYGRQISETSPKAGLATCQLGSGS